MKWLWEKILKPIFDVAVGALTVVFKWAFENPVVGVALGCGALVGSLFFPSGDATGVSLAIWGVGMITAGVLGWLDDVTGGPITRYFIGRITGRGNPMPFPLGLL